LGPKKISHTALYLALAVTLPLAFHWSGLGGRIFLPMHIPVLICGFVVGPMAGFIVGLISPFLSHLLTSMPPAYAVPLMTMELALYGLVAGFTFQKLKFNIFPALIISMIAGRLAFALGLFLLGMFIELPYGPIEYMAGGILLTSWPGILIQMVLIPPLVYAIKRTSH